MSKPEWGEKHLCPSCGALYYDMQNVPATCPKCATPYDPEALLKSRRRVVAEDTKKKVAAVVEDVEEIEIDEDAPEVDADVADEEVLEDEAEIEVEVEVEDDKDL